jgi:oligoendopeptidase F
MTPNMTQEGFRDLADERGAAAEAGALPEWNLDDLYPGMDSPQLKTDLAKSDTESVSFETRFKGKLGELAARPDAGRKLAEAVIAFEKLEELLGRIISYAGLIHAGDTSDPVRSKFFGDVQEKITAASAHLLFFALELNRIDDAVIEKAMADPALGHYRPWIEDVRKEKPYQLEPTLNFLQDPDTKKRKAASEALAKTFKANLRLFTHITNTLAKDKEISDRWRGFKDVAAARHLSNRVEPEVVDALVAAVREAYPRLSHRYYALKAKWFGRETLDHWDRNAPLPDVPMRTIPFGEARATVLGAYGLFATEMADIARRFFEERWIDAPVRPGKAPGAFAHPTVPSAHPYVLLNYQGKVRDVMTLAHELGHGVHQVLAAPQGALMAPTPLTLAETASVFGEMLTFRALLDETADAKERKAMLAAKVEDMINTVVRQVAFYSFERKLHIERREGELTSDRVGALWMEVQGESLGPAIVLHPGYETFWSYIPHFVHSPFYVYAYAFGDCLVNSLYAVYEDAADGFQEKYFALLKAGGTKHHSELLKPFGLDATDPAFWQKGLGVIEGFIGELEGMGI